MTSERLFCRSRCDGFTLLEVILAMMLAMVLLSALWVALRVNLNLFDSGRAHVEQAQLARALLRQINDDLQNVVIPPAAETNRVASESAQATAFDTDDGTSPMGGGGFSSPRDDGGFGGIVGRDGRLGRLSHLVGDQHSLEIDICRFISAVPAPAESPTADSLPVSVPEIVRVRYFLEGLDPLAEQYRDHSLDEVKGLVREELDWAAMSQTAESTAPDRRAWDSRRQGEGDSGQYDSAGVQNDDALSADGSTDEANHLFVPEAVWLELSYFDGSAWHEQWDSDELGRWPVAVDVKLTIRPEEVIRGRPKKPPEDQTAMIDPEKLPTYRLVTFIQQAQAALPAGSETEDGSDNSVPEDSPRSDVPMGEQP